VFSDPGSKESHISTKTAYLVKIANGEIQVTKKQLQAIISLYDANILYADEYVRRIIRYLDKQGLMDRVILIITADHGEAFMQHGHMVHSKSNLYDEMLHVPFVIKFPERIGMKNVRVLSLASLIDVAPTVLEMMGVKAEAAFKGQSLLPAILENREVRSLAYSGTSSDTIRCVRDTRYKYIYNPRASDELYDIAHDPLERRNIIAKKPIVGHYYLQQLKMLEQGAEKVEKTKVDIQGIDPEKIKQLKELGYVQ
jgi:arylsulfatase A-like enzyme